MLELQWKYGRLLTSNSTYYNYEQSWLLAGFAEIFEQFLEYREWYVYGGGEAVRDGWMNYQCQ